VLVLTDEPLATGIVLDVIPIGALELEDEHGNDLKIIAVAAFDPNVNLIKEYTELPRMRRSEIEQFFATYKVLEKKDVRLGSWLDATRAKEQIGNARVAFERSRKSTPLSVADASSLIRVKV
jgi:inorganic pyrophosphatase